MKNGEFEKIKTEQYPLDIQKILLDKITKQNPEIRNAVKVWHLNDSKLWYATNEQAAGYLALNESVEYKSRMHDAETDLIHQNMEKFVTYLNNDVRFLDLGCGESLKSIEIIKEAQKREKQITFYPIDINSTILDIAVKNAQQAGIKTHGLQEDFEHFDQIVSKVETDGQKFIYLGANFVNFDSNSILNKIKDSLSKEDVVYFSAQINDGNITKIIQEYNTENMGNFLFQTIKHLGFSEDDVFYEAIFNDYEREIEMYFTIQNIPDKLADSKLQTGDRLIIATSFKPTLEEFSQIAQRDFEGELLFNKGKNYVGFIGKKHTKN